MLMIIRKDVTSQLLGQDLDSRKFLRDLLKELRKLHFYRLLKKKQTLWPLFTDGVQLPQG